MADRRSLIFKPGLAEGGKPLIDFRTIPLRAVLRLAKLPPLEEEWNAHDAVGGLIDDRMFANDQYGCCVISAWAHNTLTFEKFEQGIVLDIKDQEVIDEYFRQSGGVDSGLYITKAMKEWKNTGWVAAGQEHSIYAYASVNHIDHSEVKYSIQLLNGCYFGMQVYETDIEQFRNGEPWQLTENSGQFLGGHGVYAHAYNDCAETNVFQASGKFHFCSTMQGLWCMTWGVEQFMTWDFWNARILQAYAIVDNKNKWQGDDSPVNIPLLESYLQEITGTSPDGSGCATPGIGKLLEKIKG